MLPESFSSMYVYNSEIQQHDTRCAPQLRVTRRHIEILKQAIFRGPLMYNTLPSAKKLADTICQFKLLMNQKSYLHASKSEMMSFSTCHVQYKFTVMIVTI